MITVLTILVIIVITTVLIFDPEFEFVIEDRIVLWYTPLFKRKEKKYVVLFKRKH